MPQVWCVQSLDRGRHGPGLPIQGNLAVQGKQDVWERVEALEAPPGIEPGWTDLQSAA